jgi:YD repeat-containing protein
VYGTRAHVPDAMVLTDGTVYRFITDHVGSVRLVVNAETAQIVQRMDYDAFGRVLGDTNPGFQSFGFAV